MKRFLTLAAIAAAIALSGCMGGGSSEPVETVQSAGKTVTLSAPGGKLSEGKNKLAVSFTDPSGNLVEVQAKSVRFFMPAMGTMAAMSAEAPLEPTDKTGIYQGTVELPMNGTWQTTITYSDAQGPKRAVFNIRAR